MVLSLSILIKARSHNLSWLIEARSRAGLTKREAPGKVVTARPPQHLTQLSSISYTLVSTLQNHQSKTSKLIRFGSLHFRDNWGWSCTAVRMWLTNLIFSNMQWWNCSSLMSAPLTAEEGCETSERLFYCRSLLRNNNTVINPQMFTSSYGSRRFSECDRTELPLRGFTTQICFFSRPGCLGLIIKNRVKSVFFEVINWSATSVCSII